MLTEARILCNSKSIRFRETALELPPLQSQILELEFTPSSKRRNYRKQITIRNNNNPGNTELVEVQATLISTESSALHALFYRVTPPVMRFDGLMVGSPAIRSMTIRNISSAPITLELTSSHGGELEILKERDLEDVSNSELLSARSSDVTTRARRTGNTDKSMMEKEVKMDLEREVALAMEKKERLLDIVENRQGGRGRGGNARLNERRRSVHTEMDGKEGDADTPKATQKPPHATPGSKPATPMQESKAEGVFGDKESGSRGGLNRKRATTRSSDDIAGNIGNIGTPSSYGGGTPAGASRLNARDPGRDMGLVDGDVGENENGNIIRRKVNMKELVAEAEEAPKWYFSDVDDEREYIRAFIGQKTRLMEALNSGQISRVEHDITLASKEQVELFLLFTVNTESDLVPLNLNDGKKRSVTAHLDMKMTQCDRSIFNLPPTLEMDHSEKFVIEGKVCRPVIDLVQRNINFGTMQRNEVRERMISLMNLSDLPLFYRIIKTGNFVSGSMEFPRGTTGVVRAMGSVEVPFLFNPSMHGAFCEDVKIENIAATSHSETITVKAVIQQSKNFWVEHTELACGSVLCGKGRTHATRIVITNTSNRRRTFNITKGPEIAHIAGVTKEMTFWLEHEGSVQDTVKNEEMIEALEQKLKIALRKGAEGGSKKHTDKSAKLKKEIENLKSQNSWEGTQPNESPDEGSDSGVESASDSEMDSTGGPKIRSKQKEPVMNHNSIAFSLKPQGVQTILMSIKVVPHHDQMGSPNAFAKKKPIYVTGSLVVAEERNMDVTKDLFYNFTVYFNQDEFNREKGTTPSPTLDPQSPLIRNQDQDPTGLDDGKLEGFNISDREALTVSTPYGDLGDVTVAARARTSFSISNKSDYKTTFVLLNQRGPNQKRDVLSFSIMNGEIEAGSTVVINVVATPFMPGRQSHSLIVRDILNKQDLVVTFSLCAASREYIVFPGTRKNCLHVGTVHLESESSQISHDEGVQYSKVVTFDVKSIHHEDVFIRARTNMTRQAYIWADEARTIKVNNLKVPAYSGVKLWFAIIPEFVLQDVNANFSYSEGSCRELVGGITIELFSADTTPLGDMTLKFTALLGRSMVFIEPWPMLDLGNTTAVGEDIKGSITLRNGTSQIPLPYTIVPSSDRVKVNTSVGTLGGRDTQGAKGALGEPSSCEVEILFSGNDLGLLEEYLYINNMNTVAPPIRFPLRLFVDDGSMGVVQGGAGEESTNQTDELLQFGDIYVELDADGRTKEGEICMQELVITPQVTSSTTEGTLTLQPVSDILGVGTSTDIEAHIAAVQGAPDGEKQKNLNDEIAAACSALTGSTGGDVAQPCGEQFVVRVGEPTTVSITLDPRLADACALIAKEGEDHAVTFHRKVAFYSLQHRRTMKIVNITGRFIVSYGTLSKNVHNAGTIGYINSYQDAFFDIPLVNCSPEPLHYAIHELHQDIVLTGDSQLSGIVEPMGSATLTAFLRIGAGHQASGANEWDILISNDNNSSNDMNFRVMADVSTCLLEYSGLYQTESIVGIEPDIDAATKDSTSAIVMPSQPFMQQKPSSWGDAPTCDAVMTVMSNVLEAMVDVRFGVELAEDELVTHAIRLQVLSRTNNEPLSHTELSPGEELEVRLRATLTSDESEEGEYARMELKKRLLAGSALLLGFLHVHPTSELSKAKHAEEVIPIFASPQDDDLEPVAFELSTHRMHFQSSLQNDNDEEEDEPIQMDGEGVLAGMTQSFSVRNLSGNTSLTFEIQIEGDAEAIELSIVPSSGTIAPQDVMNVTISVESWDSDMITDGVAELTLLVCSALRTGQVDRIYVAVYTEGIDFVERPSILPIEQLPLPAIDGLGDEEHTEEEMDEEDDAGLPHRVISPILPEIMLRGCTPLGEDNTRFELSIGQRVRDGGYVQWELAVENASPHPLDWCLVMCDPGSKEWLTLSRVAGTLNSQHDTATVMLTVSTAHVGSYTTYLQLLNLMSPGDIKIVKVTMEVVTFNQVGGDREDPFFSIVLHGSAGDQGSTPTITIPHAQLDHLYCDRSFVIRNTSSAPLQFFLNSDLKADRSNSILFFSLSCNSVRKFKSIVVEPNSRQRIYIFYRPHPKEADSMTSLHKTGPNRPDEDSYIVERLKIFVHCRLIKDHRKVLVLEATMMKPQMAVSLRSVVFELPAVPVDPAEVWPPEDLTPEDFTRHIVLHKFTEADKEELKFRVKHVMGFFVTKILAEWAESGRKEECDNAIEGWNGEQGDEPPTTYIIELSLDLEALKEFRSTILRDQYVEEHFRIYNSQQIFEKYVVHARLKCGARFKNTSVRTDTFDVGSKDKAAAQALEVAIVRFLTDHHKLWSTTFIKIFEQASGSPSVSDVTPTVDQLLDVEAVISGLWTDPAYNKLFLDYCFFTDELIYYALKGQASGADTHSFVGGLCTLLYSATLCNHEFDSIGAAFTKFGRPVPDLLLLWVEQLAFLLSFFPENRAVSRPLRVLLNSLPWATTYSGSPVVAAALAAGGTHVVQD